MEKIDQTLDMIFAKFDLAVEFLKNITRLEIMMKINDINKKIHSLLILLGIVVAAFWVANASSGFLGASGIKMFLYMIGSVIALIIVAYLSRDFHNACENLITANKTTLSSNAILRFSAITSLIIVALLILGSLNVLFKGNVVQALTFLFYSLLLFISAGTLFNPSLLNIHITSDSSSGEDFITIFTSYLKSFVYFERIISSLLILGGSVLLIGYAIEPSSAGNDLGSYTSSLAWAIGSVVAGIAFPIVAYLTFTIFWFVNSLLLAILSLGKSR